jgi:hypothetical protein
MAITSTTNIDPVSGTISAEVYYNGSTLIDNLTYTASSNQVFCAGSILAITISVQDFLALINFYVAFNTLIIFTYSPSQSITTPFSSVTFQQSDDGASQLSFHFLPGSIPLFYYTCTYPSGTVYIENRTLSNTLSYAQWLFFLYLASNFKLAVLYDYNL